MQSIKDIKNRIKGVEETAEITRAMGMISASKLVRAGACYNESHAYFKAVRETVYDILIHTDDHEEHPYLKKSKGEKPAFIVIASDKGLAGGYNQNVLRCADERIAKKENPIIYVIGEAAYAHFLHDGYQETEPLFLGGEPRLEDARRIVTDLIERFKDGVMDELYIVYTRMVTRSEQKPYILRVLPLLKEDFVEFIEEKAGYRILTDFEPDRKSVFDRLVPQYLIGILYSCLIESAYSEHLERMRAMNAATSSATDLIEELKIGYNKARQEKITTEIAELSAHRSQED